MNLNESMNNLKNTDIFSGYLNFNINHNDIMDEDFPKPNFDSFDKYDYFDESSIKSLNSFNESLKSNLIKSTPEKINIEAKNEINMIKNDEETAKLKMNKYFKKEQNKKSFVNIIPNKESNEKEIKQKRLIMNRESAKKSRLKKKAYIENLEKQYLIMKKEYINIIQGQKIYSNKNITIENSIKNNFNSELNGIKCGIKNIQEENIQTTNYFNKQKKIMDNILINQIEVMTPIHIKALQNRFLKLNKLENNDTFQTIKNKINDNLDIIKELYDISDNITNNINKESKGYKLYEFYSNIAILLNKYELIYKCTDKMNSE